MVRQELVDQPRFHLKPIVQVQNKRAFSLLQAILLYVYVKSKYEIACCDKKSE